MNVLSALLDSVSAALVLCIQVIILNIVSKGETIKSRLIISILITGIFGFTIEFYYDVFPVTLKLFSAFVSEFLSCFLMWFSKTNYKFSDALAILIVQEFCTLIYSVTYAALPMHITESMCVRAACRLIVVSVIMIIALIIYCKVKAQNKKLKNILNIIPKRVYFFMLLSLFIESGVITMLSYDTSYSDGGIYFVRLLMFILTVINTVIIITLLISVVYQKYSDNLNQILRRQVDSQLRHYEKREKLNTEIRGFRHDFNNHVKCLESLLAMEKYGEANRYLQKISNMMPSGEFLFQTGNYIADAILTEIQESFENVSVKFDGFIPENIDNSDLCIVLSNAMNNAAEACCKLPGDNTISVFGNYQQGIFVLIVKNPTIQKVRLTDVMPNTSKSDKESHGFGLSNIQRVVKKYHGALHTQLQDEIFTLSLTLTVNQPVFTS